MNNISNYMSNNNYTFDSGVLLSVISQSKEAMAIYTSEHLHIGFANDAMLQLWGKDRSIIGKTFGAALPEMIGQPFADLLKAVWRSGETYQATDTPVTYEIDGKLKTSYFDFEYRVIQDASQSSYCLLHTAADVTERLKTRNDVLEVNTQLIETKEGLKQRNDQLDDAEHKAQSLQLRADENEFKYRTVIDQSPAAIIVFRGPELYIDAANAPMLQLLDQQPDIIGKPLLVAIPELKGQPACDLLYEIYRTGKPVYGYDTPVQLKRNDQVETGYFNFSYTPLIENGRITGIVDMAVEVTEQVKARQDLEKALEEGNALAKKVADSESRLQSIINTMAEGMGIINTDGDIIFANPMAQRILGLQQDEITKRTFGDTRWQNLRVDGSPLPDHEHPMAVMMAAQQPVYDMEIGVKPPNADRFYISINAAPLYDSEEKLIGGVATFMDVTQRREMLNQLAERESSFRSFLQASTDLIYRMSPDWQNMYTLSGKNFLESTDSPRSNWVQTYIPAEDREKVWLAIHEAIASKHAFNHEHQVFKADGKIGWTHSRAVPMLDENGQIKEWLGAATDITWRKEEEQRKQDFIGIVSHELRSPLTALNGYVQILELKAKKINEPAIADIASKAKRQIDRMQTLISGFLDIARIGEGRIQLNLKRFDMADLVRLAEEESLATITSHRVIFAPIEHMPVEADHDKIEQVIINFINNAVKYSPKGSEINVSAVTQHGIVRVSVADRGMGISKKDQDHIFKRFYRVDRAEMQTVKGFGIGLFICKEIIGLHHGKIGLTSKPNEGSEFWFELPIDSSSLTAEFC
ncbi:MAG: PAS domain S-box protein [Sphingobacteriales bacterium]|nr:MAG: PAS domain S-box protein [Sphingobacteriales bacterium]